MEKAFSVKTHKYESMRIFKRKHTEAPVEDFHCES